MLVILIAQLPEQLDAIAHRLEHCYLGCNDTEPIQWSPRTTQTLGHEARSCNRQDDSLLAFEQFGAAKYRPNR
jgi:hypothetical protein